jgi:hypothetical protein
MPYKNTADKNANRYKLRAIPEKLSVIRQNNNKYHRTDKGRFARLRQKAGSRGIDVTLTFDEFVTLVRQPCHYCGGQLAPTGYGLDRVENNGDYSSTNVVSCCFDCNRIKGETLTYDEMVVAMKAVLALREQRMRPLTV